jgi:hypothetical protein
MYHSLTLERAVRTVVSVHTTFFLEFFCAELLLPAAACDGFLFSSELVAILGGCSGRGTGFAGAFLTGFGTARAATGLAGGMTFCKTTNLNQIKCFRGKNLQNQIQCQYLVRQSRVL